tara:strand:+ start:414 stop:734 length:321 start_codon:yes stop_codon:yes gene_type:complete
MPDESNIIVDGRQLANAESMTIRVALNSFISELNDNGLGDDDHGKSMVKIYTENAQTVLETIHKSYGKNLDDFENKKAALKKNFKTAFTFLAGMLFMLALNIFFGH